MVEVIKNHSSKPPKNSLIITGNFKNMKTITKKEPGKQEFWFERTFEAPIELVFDTYSDPSHMADWWGPAGYPIEELEMDVRSGGSWRVVQRDKDDQKFSFYGVYHEVMRPIRIVWTFEFDGNPGHVSLETVTFEEIDGKTKLIGQSVYRSIEDRDSMITSGMENGLNEGLDRLEKPLEEKLS